MKKTKVLTKLTALFLALCGGMFIACSDGNSGSSSPQENSDPTTPEEVISDPGKIWLSADGGDKTEQASIAAALAAIPGTATAENTYTITIGKGTYTENALRYTGKAALVIEGATTAQFGSDVIIAGTGSSQASMQDRCLFSVTGSADLTLKNVSFKNTTVRANVTETNASGNKLTQAEAVSFFSTGKMTAYNSGFYGHQDTLYTRGRAWFYKCYAEGDVDFLWMSGDATVALYEECTIKMVGDETNAAYIAAPGLPESSPVGKGVVILNSKIIADDALNGAAYLTRTPWSSGYYSQAAYVGCTFEGNINSNIWYGSAIEEGIDDTNVGWKMDTATARNLAALNCNTSKVKIMDDRFTEREYNGRYVILNRAFNTTTGKWQTLSEKWDAAEGLSVNEGDSITADSSKENIFVDYADVNNTNIGSALTVTDYDGEVTGAEWTCQVYSDAELSQVSSESVTVDSNGTTSTASTANIYVLVKASKNGASDSVIVYSVKATAITISDETASIAEGSEKQLSVSFEPDGASAEVEWTSSDSSIATVDENGLVKALEGQSGKTATITATVKDNNSLTASCVITVTDAAILKKFGTSVASLENYTDYAGLGASDVLIYPVAIDASATATKTYEISAVIEYSAAATGGAGFVSFKDGAYSDGAMRSYAWTTPAGVKSYDGFSAHGQGYDKDYKTYANAAGTYTVKAYTKKDGYLYFSLTNSDGVEMIKNSPISYYVPCTSDYIYLAVGGASGMKVSASDITITIKEGDTENSMKVSKFTDLGADTRTETTSGAVTASLTLSADDYSSVKGAAETIVMSNVAVPVTSASTSGTWLWDATTVTYSGSGDLVTTASFIPEDRSTYKAILSANVTISVTDERTEGKQYVYNVVSESFAATGDIQNSVNNTYYGDGTHGNMVVDTLTYNSTTEKEGGSAATGKMSKGAGAHQTRNTVLYIPVDTGRISDSHQASITITPKDGANFNNSNVYGGANDSDHKLTADSSNIITYTFTTGDLVTAESETAASVNATVTAALDSTKSYAKIIIRHNGGDSYYKSITLTYTDND